MSASLSEDVTSNARSDAQKAIEQATSRLSNALPSRPSAAIQAEIDGILIDPRLEGCKEINGHRTKETCPHVADLRTELAKAQGIEQDRAQAQGTLDKAHAQIAALPAPKVANSDAKAVAQLLNSLGYEPTVAQVNTALALLSVLLIEMGEASRSQSEWL